MTVGIALIRGINVGGKSPLPMALLRGLCEGVGLREPRTYIQSGSVVFRADGRAMAKAAGAIEEAIAARCGFRPCVVVRTLDEVRRAARANPLASIRGADKRRLLIMFLAGAPTAGARRAVAALDGQAERVMVVGREAFLHFPDGIATSKLSMTAVERALGVAGTCRNLNTVEKLLAMGEEIEGRPSCND